MNSRSLIVLLLITLVAARGNFRQKQPPNSDQAPPPPPPPNEGQRNEFLNEIKRPTIIYDATKDSQKSIGNINGNEERDWREVKASWKSNQVEAEIKQKQREDKIALNEFFEKKRISDKANANNFNPDDKEDKKSAEELNLEDKKPAEEFNLREELREARRKSREDRLQQRHEKPKESHRDYQWQDYPERNDNNATQDPQP